METDLITMTEEGRIPIPEWCSESNNLQIIQKGCIITRVNGTEKMKTIKLTEKEINKISNYQRHGIVYGKINKNKQLYKFND